MQNQTSFHRMMMLFGVVCLGAAAFAALPVSAQDGAEELLSLGDEMPPLPLPNVPPATQAEQDAPELPPIPEPEPLPVEQPLPVPVPVPPLEVPSLPVPPAPEITDDPLDTEASPEENTVIEDVAEPVEPAVPAVAIDESGVQDAPAGNGQPAAPSATLVEDNTPWQGSLMFPQKRVDDLMSIYEAYLINQARLTPNRDGSTSPSLDVGTIIRSMDGEKGKEIPEEVLDLTLNSIVYYNAKDWSVWLNGQRFFKKDAEGGFVVGRSTLRVLSATEREIVLVWTPIPESFPRVAERWQQKQRMESVKSLLTAQNERVDFSTENANITITLRPNQTFVSQAMSVLEGGRPSIATGLVRGGSAQEVDGQAPGGIVGAPSAGGAIQDPMQDSLSVEGWR